MGMLRIGLTAPSGAPQVPVIRPPAILMELVERFRVQWEIVPEASLVGTGQRRVAFTLELCGTHEPRTEHPAEGCIHCHNVFASLHVIADWILPREDIRMGEAEVHFPGQICSPERQRTSSVRFAIRVAHRRVPEEIAHETVTQWLKGMGRRLKDLGATELRAQAALLRRLERRRS